jgi:hypothetical protein
MSSMAAKITAAYFESKGLDFMISDDGSVITTEFRLENLDGINIFIRFDAGDHTVHLRTSSIITFPKAKTESMYALANALNGRFRWIKFVVDEENASLIAEDDAVIQLDSCGEEVLECSLHFAKIVDAAYPVITNVISV